MRDQGSAPRNGVVVAHGYGIKIYVERGHLVVHDGRGRDRRTRQFNRATSKLKRLVVFGHTGYITLDATRWPREIGAAFIQLDADGDIVALTASRGTDLPPLRRAQALAAYTDAGLAVARLVLTEKTDGQAALLPELQATDEVHRAMRDACHAIGVAATIDDLLAAEAAAASAYWEAWAPVPVPFGPRDSARVPEHWCTFGQRHSSLTGSPRLAINVANAVLNYLYSLLEAETTLACMAIGLDPGLGIFHTDKRARDSLAVDVMETCRPLVDAYLLALLRHRTLNRTDFAESGRGECRIRPSLASQLAETLPTWRTNIGPAVERVAQTIADNGPTNLDVPTSLSGANRRASWHARRPRNAAKTAAVPALPATCRGCGSHLPNRRRRYCDACRRVSAELAGQSGRAAAATALERLRTDGRDPAHGGIAARQRGAKNAAHQRELVAWTPTPGETYDTEGFTNDILPRLRDRSIGELVVATGLSDHYCSLIRLGKRIPHARHWAALRVLASTS
jgi:CRISPR-associated endonuclease Cas1